VVSNVRDVGIQEVRRPGILSCFVSMGASGSHHLFVRTQANPDALAGNGFTANLGELSRPTFAACDDPDEDDC